MKRWSIVFVVMAMVIFVSLSVRAQDATPEMTSDAGEAASILFVQTGESGTLSAGGDGTYTLTLDGVDAEVLWFTDRPARNAGYLKMTDYLQIWDEGADSFETDPPNASIIIDGQPVGIEITNPVYDEAAETLTYTTTLLDDSASFADGATLSAPDLFIDGWFGTLVTVGSCTATAFGQFELAEECGIGVIDALTS